MFEYLILCHMKIFSPFFVPVVKHCLSFSCAEVPGIQHFHQPSMSLNLPVFRILESHEIIA